MRYFYLGFILICLTVVGVAGFRGEHFRRPPIELFPDMVRQAKLRPQTPSEFFPDEMSSRARPEGTVARSKPYEIDGQLLQVNGKPVYSYEDSPVNTGKIAGTTNCVETNPLPVTRQLLERGQQRYQIYCSPCH